MLSAGHDQHRQRGLVVLADHQQVAAALGAEDGGGRVLDRDRVAQPGLLGPRAARARSGRRASGFRSGFLLATAGRLPSKTIGVAGGRCCVSGELLDLPQVVLAPLVGQPDDLEQVVALRPGRWRRCRSPRRGGSAAGRRCCPRSGSGGRRPRCTAARCARPSGRACCGPASRPRPGSASRGCTWMPNARPWRTRRSSSSDDFLGDLVVLDEELLELVDDQAGCAASARRAGRRG